jgi:type II secretory pathway component PulC
VKKDICLVLLSIILLLFPVLIYSKEIRTTSIHQQLPFKLLATILGSYSSEASCVMMNLNNNKQETYMVGDRIFGYQIAIITRGSVTLLKEGEFSFLNLPLGDEKKLVYDDSHAIKIRRSLIQKEIPDLNFLLNQVFPITIIESGKVIGLMIPPLNNKPLQYLLKMAALKERDIATSINGEGIDSLKKALELYNKYKGKERIEVEIKRDGSIKNLTYQIK